MKLGEQKCTNIQNDPPLTNVSELQSFLGIVQYLPPFIPHSSNKTNYLNEPLVSHPEICQANNLSTVLKTASKQIINQNSNSLLSSHWLLPCTHLIGYSPAWSPLLAGPWHLVLHLYPVCVFRLVAGLSKTQLITELYIQNIIIFL